MGSGAKSYIAREAKKGTIMTDHSPYLTIHYDAVAAAKAATAYLAEGRGPDCGFAWVQLCPGTHPFVRALKAAGLGRKHWQSGWVIWDPADWPGQSIGPKLVGANAYAEHVRDALCAANSAIEVSVGSRYD